MKLRYRVDQPHGYWSGGTIFASNMPPISFNTYGEMNRHINKLIAADYVERKQRPGKPLPVTKMIKRMPALRKEANSLPFDPRRTYKFVDGIIRMSHSHDLANKEWGGWDRLYHIREIALKRGVPVAIRNKVERQLVNILATWDAYETWRSMQDRHNQGRKIRAATREGWQHLFRVEDRLDAMKRVKEDMEAYAGPDMSVELYGDLQEGVVIQNPDLVGAVEIFEVTDVSEFGDALEETGWYWQFIEGLGFLTNDDPHGPFDTRGEAHQDWKEYLNREG